MPDLQLSRSAPTPISGFRARLRSDAARRPSFQQTFPAQYLDDVSYYHGGDRDSKHQGHDIETDDSDELEQETNQDYDQVARRDEDEAPEVRVGIRDTRDLEANSEIKSTTRSIKDPNLV